MVHIQLQNQCTFNSIVDHRASAAPMIAETIALSILQQIITSHRRDEPDGKDLLSILQQIIIAKEIYNVRSCRKNFQFYSRSSKDLLTLIDMIRHSALSILQQIIVLGAALIARVTFVICFQFYSRSSPTTDTCADLLNYIPSIFQFYSRSSSLSS